MTNESQKTKPVWITEGLIIATLTALSYAIAFVFEAGIANHFGLPLDFIEVNLTGIFLALVALLGSLLIILSLLELLNPLWGKLPDPIRRRLRLYFGFFFAIIGSLIIAGGSIESIKYILIWGCIMAFLDFILPALSRKKDKNYAERIQEIHEADLRYDTFIDKLIKHFRLDYSTFQIILLVIYIVILSFYSGLGTARRQKDFLVLQDNKNQVVLRKYGDLIITAEFDRDKKELSNIFSIYRIDPGRSFSFQEEEVGPLLKNKNGEKELKNKKDK